ncbi:hypothetical protein Tco_0393948 [Tanacetum coccineum]
MQELSGQLQELQNKSKEEHGVHLKLVLESLRKEKLYAKFSKSNVVGDALSRNERVKSRRVRGMIPAAQSEAFKQENVLAERLRGLDQQMERKSTDVPYKYTSALISEVCLRYLSENEIESPWILSLNSQGQSSEYDVIWVMVDRLTKLQMDVYLWFWQTLEKVLETAIGCEYCLASTSCLNGHSESMIQDFRRYEEGMCLLILGGRIFEHSCLRKSPKRRRDRPKEYVDYRRKPLEFEVGDRVLLKVTPWKGVVRFGKKGKLAPRYVGPFEILERIGLVAYRLRLPKELSSVHDTFHVSNLKKCLAYANLHVPLEEIKVDKTLRFVEEPIEIMDQEIKKLKRRKIALVKVRWNSKRGPEFTWEHEDQMRIRYPHLFMD